MNTNKYAAKSYEQQHLQRVRKFTHATVDMNIALGDAHRVLAKQIDITAFEKATEYVDQYVSYTTIWNMKFVYNLESPEIAMLQLFHIEYVLAHLPEDKFLQERAIVADQHEKFVAFKPFTDEVVKARFEKFMEFVEA